MNKYEFKLIPARRGDAKAIADAVIAAIGEEIAVNLAALKRDCRWCTRLLNVLQPVMIHNTAIATV